MSERSRPIGSLSSPLIDLPLQPTDDSPFLRPRTRTKVRRARRSSLARLALALQLGSAVFLTVAGVCFGYSKLMSWQVLKVSRLDIRGGRFLSEGEVRELLGPAVGENILTLDLASFKTRLQSSPWVAEATVRRALPDRIEVDIRERVPVALAEVDQLHVMDDQGTLIEIYGPRTAGFDLPIVRGLSGSDTEARSSQARRAGALLADLADSAVEVSEVQVEPSGDLRVVLRGRGEVLRMGTPPYRNRFRTFLALRRELAQRNPRAEYFDLRFRDRIYAKEPTAASPPSATPVKASPSTGDQPDARIPGGAAGRE